MGSIVLQGQKGSIVLQNLQNHGLKDKIVILPMVLQIRETMVLQEVELEGKDTSSYLWVFGA
jgi:hypothetical protein